MQVQLTTNFVCIIQVYLHLFGWNHMLINNFMKTDWIGKLNSCLHLHSFPVQAVISR